jgi:hypothetical protein
MQFQLDGTSATAELLEDEAPETSRQLWDALPITTDLRHARWSGNAAYAMVPAVGQLKLENQVSFIYPATVVYQPDEGELLISYGQAQMRDASGNGWASYFARLEGDASEFLAAVQRTQAQGVKRLTIRRLGE